MDTTTTKLPALSPTHPRTPRPILPLQTYELENQPSSVPSNQRPRELIIYWQRPLIDCDCSVLADTDLPVYRYEYTGNFSNISPRPWIGASHSCTQTHNPFPLVLSNRTDAISSSGTTYAFWHSLGVPRKFDAVPVGRQPRNARYVVTFSSVHVRPLTIAPADLWLSFASNANVEPTNRFGFKWPRYELGQPTIAQFAADDTTAQLVSNTDIDDPACENFAYQDFDS